MCKRRYDPRLHKRDLLRAHTDRLAIIYAPFPVVRVIHPRTWAGANVGEKMRNGNTEGRVESYSYDTFR